MVKMAEVASINPTLGDRPRDDDVVAFLGMADVSENGSTTVGDRRLYSDVSKGYTPFRNEDLLVAKITPCFENGKIAQAKIGQDAGFGSTEFHVVRPDPSRLDARYALHFLRSPRVRQAGQLRMTGSGGQRRVPRAFIEDLEIPLPPLPEQRRIASILDRAGGLVQLRERSRHLMHELESRLFASFFRDELLGGANAATIPLGEIAQCSSGITKGRRTAEPTSPTPYMAVSNVQDRRLDLSVVKLIDATEVERDRFRLASGDLLLTEGGDPDKLGRGTVWRDEIEGAIHQNHIFRVRLTDENYLPDYLNWLLASDYGKSYFLSRAKQTTGIATINQTQLKAFPVIATKPERQRAFVGVLEAARASACVADRHATRLTDLMVGLQARAFRGEL